MLAAAALGAFFCVHLVTKWDVNKIRIGMGIALFCCAIVFICKLMNVGPFGAVGTALGLHGIKMVIGLIVNFFLGSFMMIGFGLYQPCMALVMILGMSVGVAFPIMMGSCAVLVLTAAPTFIKTGRYRCLFINIVCIRPDYTFLHSSCSYVLHSLQDVLGCKEKKIIIFKTI